MFGGELGESSDWFSLFEAAEILKAPPWVVLEKPLFWQDYARRYKRIKAKIENYIATKSRKK